MTVNLTSYPDTGTRSFPLTIQVVTVIRYILQSEKVRTVIKVKCCELDDLGSIQDRVIRNFLLTTMSKIGL
jgi:hypothetical protein